MRSRTVKTASTSNASTPFPVQISRKTSLLAQSMTREESTGKRWFGVAELAQVRFESKKSPELYQWRKPRSYHHIKQKEANELRKAEEEKEAKREFENRILGLAILKLDEAEQIKGVRKTSA